MRITIFILTLMIFLIIGCGSTDPIVGGYKGPYEN